MIQKRRADPKPGIRGAVVVPQVGCPKGGVPGNPDPASMVEGIVHAVVYEVPKPDSGKDWDHGLLQGWNAGQQLETILLVTGTLIPTTIRLVAP